MQWYYQQDNAAQGPVSEEVFRAKIADGTIRPETLVWHDGMAEWQPLSVAAPSYAGGAEPPPIPDMFVPAGATATFDELKTCARTGPQGNYWIFFGAIILWDILLGLLRPSRPCSPASSSTGLRTWPCAARTTGSWRSATRSSASTSSGAPSGASS